METDSVPHILALDRLKGGLAICFSDGIERFYPDGLLYEVLKRAEEIPDEGELT